jgi:hypothetical protein
VPSIIRFKAAIGLSPIARINNADKKAARNKDIKGTMIISTHLGIISMLMLRYGN